LALAGFPCVTGLWNCRTFGQRGAFACYDAYAFELKAFLASLQRVALSEDLGTFARQFTGGRKEGIRVSPTAASGSPIIFVDLSSGRIPSLWITGLGKSAVTGWRKAGDTLLVESWISLAFCQRELLT